MNNDDDFGQYNCIAENTHGRREAIVFVLSMLFWIMINKNLSFFCFRRISYNKKISSSFIILHENKLKKKEAR